MFEGKQSNGMFDGASPKLIFSFGLLLGLAIVSVIVLGVLLAGGFSREAASTTTVRDIPTTPPPPTNAATDPAIGNFRAVSGEDHVRGDVNAPITIVEWSDTECPFCKNFHTTMKQVMEEYDGQVRWVYRHFPLRQLHSKAAKEAEATECAGELGGEEKFWEYLDRIFAITPSNDGLDPAELPRIATSLGLNEKAFTTCLESGRHAQTVSADERDAVAAGGRGTPYSVVVDADGTRVALPGALPFYEVQPILDGMIQ